MASIKGWVVLAHPLFVEQVNRLIAAVEAEKTKKPDDYLQRANAKVLTSIVKLVNETIPADPGSPMFRQGNTLGSEHRHWRRAKFGNGRFRLFFRYGAESKIIILAWVNDTQSLRTRGARTDAYRVFKGMLDNGNPPGDWNALRTACDQLDDVLGGTEELL